MGRIRSIKPDFFLDDKLGDLQPLARLLFAGLWTQADCAGRLEDRPRRLKVELLPYDDCDVEDLLGLLADGGFVVRYEVGGRRVIQVTNFLKHQRLSGKEAAGKSDLPAPPRTVQQRGSVGEASVTQPRSDDEAANVQEGKGRERKGIEKLSSTCVDPPPAPEAGAAELPDPVQADLLPGPTPEALQALWNDLAGPTLARCRDLTEKRRRHCKTRLARRGLDGPGGFREVVERINASPFLRGEAGKWRASFDWLIESEDNPVKVLEGKYDDSGGGGRVPSNAITEAAKAVHASTLGEINDF